MTALIGGTTAHSGRAEFAVDFLVAIGTVVTAVRGGLVVAIQEGYLDGDTVRGHENYVFILHEDGSTARYIHLTHEGVLVNLNDRVSAGTAIALSGHTGDSRQPHLHLDVAACCCNLPGPGDEYYALPCGQTQPLTFRNTRANPCGLQTGQQYTALPF